MTSFSRGIHSFNPKTEFKCLRCLQFSTIAAPQSGHNRWSKIKHDKGAADAKKNTKRSIFSRDIALASKLYGGDPNANPRLAAILTTAKKAGFPKASMEAAIARGQGKTTTGTTLENVTIEAILPSTVAIIIEMETDNRNRTLMDLRNIIKIHGGNVTPTSYLFQKKGRVAFETAEQNITIDEVLEEAIEAGAEDVETDENGNIVVWTEPNMTTATASALQKSHGLKIDSANIIWDAHDDTKVLLEESNVVKGLVMFLEAVQEITEVQGVYANVAQGLSLDIEVWEDLQERIDA